MGLSGAQKAAVVLAQLNEQRAAKVLKAMSEAEVVQLMGAMANLPPLAVDEVREVLGEFAVQATALLQVGQGGVEVARRLLAERVGPARADEILEDYLAEVQPHPLGFLHRIDPHQIVGFIGDEHPQLVAVVLANLPPDRAAEVLKQMDDRQRADVARRIATMGHIAPEALNHLVEVLEHKLANLLRTGSGPINRMGGVSSVVAILNHTDRPAEKQILAELEESDPVLAERIRSEMFVFDDVVGLDDRTLQRVLRNIVPKDLAVALKGVDETVRDKFLRNLSERAAADLVEEIEVLGPTRVSQVEAAQGAIVRNVRELEAAGEIVLARADDEFV